MILSLLTLFLVGCSTTQNSSDGIDRSSASYKIAKHLHGLEAEEEFIRNKKKEELWFYAIESETKGEYLFPGLTKEEIELYVEKMDIGFEVIDDFLDIHISTDGPDVSHCYSIVVRDFAEQYNRLILSEYKNRAYQVVAHNSEGCALFA
ncbi:hypothetical protein QEH56_24345 [Pelagicoccus enzymogenes]|uniref:hypothetical protein n=1 Tax=Pelagicoccus enzymogenes TaxID=2773457 RepID=UPI00281090C4|nr:hypothetical protein [Pelagicoccus enzymogenes]MDQ8201312.1 hypothetical protein [Pelagicoccus enzymogenes]